MTSPLILASGSAHRAALLTAASVPFRQVVSGVDEDDLKKAFNSKDLALHLAEAKAADVARNHPGSLVLGADQVLLCEGRSFDKPASRQDARSHLQALSGRTHTLETAVVVIRDNKKVWAHMERPALTMRTLSDDFIEHYLDAAGDGVLTSVGAYQVEGLGAQLFDRIEGDTFSIQGLPLIPLLKFLRSQGLMPS